MDITIKIPQVLENRQYLRLPSHEREQYIREIVRKTLKLNPNGVRIPTLSKHLPLDERTISKHLAIMQYTNEVYSKKDGNNVYFFPNSKLMHPASEEAFDLGNIEFQVYQLRNERIGEAIFIQERRKDEYRDDIGSGIIIPVEKFKDFVNYLAKIGDKL